MFKPIGHCWEAKPGILIFTNRSYPRRSDIASYPPYGQKFYLSARDPGLLKSVRQIAIRIIRTGGGSVPVIGSLCIRGHVAHPERERFVKPVSSSVPIPPYTTPVTVVGESHPHTNPQKDSVQSLHLMKDTYTEPVEGISKDIPAEMLDPLTLTPMSLPIILPSGYTIDQSTLDRHVEAQKTWGRPPTDPFTGLLLQETNRPVFNTKLKERIDKHALINDINLPRTSGRKRDLGNEVVTNTKKLKQPDIPTVTRDCEDDSISNKLYQLLNRSSSHRTISLPRKETSIMCVGCNKSGLELTLYKLSCNHVICRSCLLAQNTRSIKCNDCNALSEKSSLVRQFRYTWNKLYPNPKPQTIVNSSKCVLLLLLILES